MQDAQTAVEIQTVSELIREKAEQILEIAADFKTEFEKIKSGKGKEAAYRWLFKHAARMMFAEKLGLYP